MRRMEEPMRANAGGVTSQNDDEKWRVASLSPSFGRFDPTQVDRLRSRGIEVCFLDQHGTSPEELADALADCQVLIAGTTPVTDETISMAPGLRLIAKHGVGVENIDVDAATRRGIYVTNVPGASASAVAELAFGHILALARGIVRVDRRVRQGEWPTEIGMDLHGAALGIVGTGRIGQAVGAIANGFGMRIIAYDPVPSEAFASTSGARYLPLRDLLEAADIVTLHVPLSSDTRHLIGAAELRIMKFTALLVNTSRGSIVDEEALVEALVTDEIAGAGLDVYEFEPPKNRRLLELEKVVVTSHIGAYTHGALASVSAETAENILRLVDRSRPQFVVNGLD